MRKMSRTKQLWVTYVCQTLSTKRFGIHACKFSIPPTPLHGFISMEDVLTEDMQLVYLMFMHHGKRLGAGEEEINS